MRDGTPTRERIERKAMELFVAQGVAETTIRDIAEAADIAEGALYRHYRGKDELILALFQQHYAAFAERLEALQMGHRGTREKLRAMIEECARIFDTDPVRFQFLLLVQHHSMRRLGDSQATPVEVVRRVLLEGMARREIPTGDPDLAAALVMGLIVQPATFKTYGRIPGPMMPLAPVLAEACWRVLDA
jgi:AcrR family transcriptional regulator